MSYDAWKTRSDWDEEGRVLSRSLQQATQIRKGQKLWIREIEWLTTETGQLCLSRTKTSIRHRTIIFELSQERESLKRCFNV
jgi:hypothetical protein